MRSWYSWRALAATLFVVAFLAIICFKVSELYIDSKRTESMLRAEEIMAMIHNFRSANNRLPSAYLESEDGTPLLSWRLQVLEFQEHKRLSSTYDPSKSWFAPENLWCKNQRIEVFESPRCRRKFPGATNFIAVVDTNTYIQKPPALELAQSEAQRKEEVVAIIEWDDSEIHWAEPRDIDIPTAISYIQSSHRDVVAALGNGKSMMISPDTTADEIRWLFSGDSISLSD